jgi:hypothetical protein
MAPKSPPGNESDSQDLFRDQESTNWKVYSSTSRHFRYRVEYPSDWSVEENENISFFRPPHAKSKAEYIAIVVINYEKTPRLPVEHTYTTIRVVTVDAEEIPVRERQPAPATEKYFAEQKKGDHVAEFRFFLDRQYDAVFDRMLSTFTFVE